MCLTQILWNIRQQQPSMAQYEKKGYHQQEHYMTALATHYPASCFDPENLLPSRKVRRRSTTKAPQISILKKDNPKQIKHLNADNKCDHKTASVMEKKTRIETRRTKHQTCDQCRCRLCNMYSGHLGFIWIISVYGKLYEFLRLRVRVRVLFCHNQPKTVGG